MMILWLHASFNVYVTKNAYILLIEYDYIHLYRSSTCVWFV